MKSLIELLIVDIGMIEKDIARIRGTLESTLAFMVRMDNAGTGSETCNFCFGDGIIDCYTCPKCEGKRSITTHKARDLEKHELTASIDLSNEFKNSHMIKDD